MQSTAVLRSAVLKLIHATVMAVVWAQTFALLSFPTTWLTLTRLPTN